MLGKGLYPALAGCRGVHACLLTCVLRVRGFSEGCRPG
ncbi:hypothetical protein GZL_02926 [Streptomyces sp. 769]|nr:hypothetical protein GZL_02926 [Streptomyces sp. 769]